MMTRDIDEKRRNPAVTLHIIPPYSRPLINLLQGSVIYYKTQNVK